MKLATLSLLGIFVIAGCSSNPVTPPTSTQVNYTQNQSYIYYAQNLNATTGAIIPGSGDTITSTVLQTGISYQGKSNVTMIQNKHSNAGSGVSAMDTTYIAQENGNFWHYDFGLESLNKNPAVLSFNGGKTIQAGWVLQAKLAEDSGGTWIAADTTISVGTANPVLTDTAMESGDTIITQGGIPDVLPSSHFTTNAKHSVHTVNINAQIATARGPIDTYVSAQYGQVLTIVHPATLAGQAAPGQMIQLIAVP